MRSTERRQSPHLNGTYNHSRRSRMASKRVMYKPATKENIKQRRPLLSQGRLVSGNDTTKPRAVNLASGIEVAENKKPLSPLNGSQNSAPRSNVPALFDKHVSINSTKRDSLDLSESDDDVPPQYKSQETRIYKQQPSEVLIVDASRQTKDPNHSEVDIKVGYEKSPVRVVCHSASNVFSDVRSSGDRSVQIEGVPKIDVKATTPLSPTEPCRTLDNLPLLTQIEKDMRNCRLPQPNFDDSQDSDISEKPVHDVGLHPDNDSVASDVKSVPDLKKSSPSNKRKVHNQKKTNQPGKTPQTARKKSTRTVQSRYLQAADAKVKSSVSLLCPKTSKIEKNVSKAGRSMDFGPKSARKVSRKTPATPLTTQKPKPFRPDSSRVVTIDTGTSQEAPHTPDNSHLTAGGQTSTPTHDGSDFPQDIDASAIHPEISVLSTGEGSKINHSVLSNISTHLPPKKKKQAKMTQQQLDMIYARYIQSLYLSTKAQKVREDQEKQAMAQIMGIYTEVEKLQKKNHELDKELSRLKHLNEVDQQIDLQRQSLGPIVSSLPQLTKEYDTLAHALDTTRHQISTKGVYIPDDEEQYQRDLEQCLLESEQLLGELSVMTRQDLPSVTSMSNALTAMEKATEGQVEELVRCNEMLSATQSLTVQETSMKIQAIQAREIGVM